MKRIAAILLMGLLLFNWYGYQLFYNYLQQRADRQMDTSLDQDQYSANDLITLKIPLHLPYISSQADFRRVDGEVNLQGIAYKYVKRKIDNDTLYLLCLPNEGKMKLASARNEYFKSVADIQHSGKAKDNHSTVKNPISDYVLAAHGWCLPSIAVYENQFFLPKQPFYCSPVHGGPKQPPEILS